MVAEKPYILDKFNTAQWINPKTYLSYQLPEKPFVISEEDFRKTAMDYLCFKEGIDTKTFNYLLLNSALYASKVVVDGKDVNIKLERGAA